MSLINARHPDALPQLIRDILWYLAVDADGNVPPGNLQQARDRLSILLKDEPVYILKDEPVYIRISGGTV